MKEIKKLITCKRCKQRVYEYYELRDTWFEHHGEETKNSIRFCLKCGEKFMEVLREFIKPQ